MLGLPAITYERTKFAYQYCKSKLRRSEKFSMHQIYFHPRIKDKEKAAQFRTKKERKLLSLISIQSYLSVLELVIYEIVGCESGVHLGSVMRRKK